MSDEMKFVITVVFPPTQVPPIEELGQTEPSIIPQYALKYLFITNLIPYPEWDDDDERW